MIERVHEHLIGELSQNARTDAVFIVTSILLSIIILATNAFLAGSGELTASIVMVLLILLQICIVVAAIFGLLKGKRMRSMLLRGLMDMYRDRSVDKYYDEAMVSSYAVPIIVALTY